MTGVHARHHALRAAARAGLLTCLIAACTLGAATSSLAAANPIDTTFGQGGAALAGTVGDPGGVGVDGTDRVLLVNYGALQTPPVPSTLLRFTPSGALDTSFGRLGKSTLPAGYTLGGMQVQPDGSIMFSADDSTNQLVVFRITSTGSFDLTFGDHGFAASGVHVFPGQVVVAPNGEIWASGIRNRTSGASIVAFTSTGMLDTGVNVRSATPGVITTNGIGRLAVDSDDGDSIVTDCSDCLARYQVTGALDDSFGSHGSVALPFFGSGTATRVGAITVTPSGRIYATVADGETADQAVVKLTPDGVLDSTFGTNGTATFPMPGCAPYLQGVAVTAQGIYVGGIDADCGQSPIRLEKLALAGTVDTSYADSGLATVALGSTNVGFDGGISVQANGDPIVSGWGLTPATSAEPAALRLSPTATGSPPPTTAPPASTPPTLPVTVPPTNTPPGGTPPADAKLPPAVALTSPKAPTVLRATVTLRWSAPSATPALRFDVRYRHGSATTGLSGWTAPPRWQSHSSAPLTATLTPGQESCFSIRSRTSTGATSGWSPPRCVTRATDDRALHPGPGWVRGNARGAYLTTLTSSSQRGATLTTTTVHVTRIGVLLTRCPGCGAVAVYLGKHKVGQVSAAGPTRAAQLFLLAPTAARTGVVTLAVVSSGRPVHLDGLVLITG